MSLPRRVCRLLLARHYMPAIQHLPRYCFAAPTLRLMPRRRHTLYYTLITPMRAVTAHYRLSFFYHAPPLICLMLRHAPSPYAAATIRRRAAYARDTHYAICLMTRYCRHA